MTKELTYTDNNINILHNKINNGLKTTVKWAIEIGRRLGKAKKEVGYGNFANWIKNNCNFDDNTAYRYIKLNLYYYKIPRVGNLQEAYKLIEFEEKKEKEAKQKEQSKKIQYREKYNEKPDDWTRADDYAWQKKKKDDQERTERIEKLKTSTTEETIKQEKEEKRNQEWINKVLNDTKEKAQRFDQLRISSEGQDIISIISDYIDNLPDNNRRIEACQNIVKFCRNKSAELQRIT